MVKRGLVILAALISCGTTILTGCSLAPKTGVDYSYYYPDWTPDGKIICIKKAEEWTETTPWPYGAPMRSVSSTKYYIVTMSEEGTQEINVKQIDRMGKVAASPLGNYIAYTDGNYIRIISASDANSIDTGAEIESIDWAPNGNQLVYGSNVDLSTDNRVVVINRDGSGKQTIAYGRTPSWMSTGEANKLVFSNQNNGRITFYDITTGATNEIAYLGFHFDWHPSGQKIFYVYYGVWSINVDGSNNQKLINNSLSPKLSPDGKKLVYGDSNNTGRWISNDDGTSLRQIK